MGKRKPRRSSKIRGERAASETRKGQRWRGRGSGALDHGCEVSEVVGVSACRDAQRGARARVEQTLPSTKCRNDVHSNVSVATTPKDVQFNVSVTAPPGGLA